MVTSNCQVLLCDFHREQGWLHWFTLFNNGMREHKKLCLQLLRKITTFETFEEYTEPVKELKIHEIWALLKAAGFRESVEETWLSNYY